MTRDSGLTVAETFDPYLDWLEVRVADRPPNHYQLLGLDDFSDDPRRILAAADGMLARVRSFRPGPHLKQWQQILDELLTAKLCLTDSARRQQYDEQLRARPADSASEVPSTSEPVRTDPDLLPPSAASLVPPTPVQEPAPAQPVAPWPVQPAPAAVPVARPVQPLAIPVRAVPVAPPAAQDGSRTMMGPGPLAPLARPVAPALNVPRPAPAMQAYPAAVVPTVVPLARVTPVTPQANVPAEEVEAFRSLLDSTVFEPHPHPHPANRAAASSPYAGPIASADAPRPSAQPLPLSGESRPLGAPSEPILPPYTPPPRAKAAGNHPALVAGGAAVVAVLVVIGLVVGSRARRASRPTAVAVDQPADSSPVSPADSQSGSTPSEDRPVVSPRKRPKPVVDVVIEDSPDGEVSKQPSDAPAGETHVETPAPPDPRPAPPEKAPRDAAKSAALGKAIASARGALAGRDVARAKQGLADAEKLVQSDDDRHDLDRMRALAGYVGGFWQAVRDAIKGLQVADELTVGNTVVAVVSAEDDSLVLHAGGSNREYTIKTLPAGLAMTLAQRWFSQDAAANSLFLGAFQAVDPNGDLKEARRLWEKASAGGASAADLLPLLTPGSASLPDELQDLPSASAAADAQRRLKLSWRKEYQLAKSPTLKVELAEKLLGAAATSQDPLERYAMFREALELGSSAADPPSILAAVDQMAHWYKIDALELTADALAKAGSAANNPQAAKSVTESALKLLDEALAAKQIKPAGRLSQAAVAAARKSRDAQLVKTVNQRQQEVQELLK